MTAHHPAPQPPLWRHLWGWTLVAMAAAWAVIAGVAYYTGLHEADEISDGQLVATAQLWLALPDLPHPPLGQAPAQPGGLKTDTRGYEQPQAVMVWQSGQLVLDSHGLARHWPVPDTVGHHTQVVTVQGQARHWRQYTEVTTAPVARRVTVVVDLDARNALGRDMALHIARPAFVVLPLVAWLLAWALRRGLRPLRRLSADIDGLDLSQHQRLGGQHRFGDFASTVTAINALVDRLDAQVQQERAFASDIAHELRTPLTAISLQAHAVAHGADGPERDAAALALQTQALHAGDILSQLLAFARAQRQGDGGVQPVCLADLLKRVVAQHAQAAHDSGHELALEVTPDTATLRLPGRPLLLELAVRNLVDNALRHTPRGTQVWVTLAQVGTQVHLAVGDDAPGTPPPATGPDQPAAGLGLGLTLVKRIAAWHGAQWQVSLAGAAPPPWTTRCALVWPRTALSPP